MSEVIMFRVHFTEIRQAVARVLLYGLIGGGFYYLGLWLFPEVTQAGHAITAAMATGVSARALDRYTR